MTWAVSGYLAQKLTYLLINRVRPIEIFSISADTDNLQNRNADYLQIQIICRYGFIGRYQSYLPIFLNLQILLAGITDNICRYGLYLQIWTHICRYCRYTDMPIHTVFFIRDTLKWPICLSLKFYLMFSQNFPYGQYKLSLIDCLL